jgi:hypothetical protein
MIIFSYYTTDDETGEGEDETTEGDGEETSDEGETTDGSERKTQHKPSQAPSEYDLSAPKETREERRERRRREAEEEDEKEFDFDTVASLSRKPKKSAKDESDLYDDDVK